jgi:hypothetical protein
MASSGDAIMERIIEYIRGILPAALDGIEGSTDEEIVHFENSRVVRMSDIHRAFLRRMGRSIGGIGLGTHDSTLAALREMYAQTEGVLPEGFELFAVDRDDPYVDMFLLDSGDEEPAVGMAYSAAYSDFSRIAFRKVEIICGSVSELLCYNPYLKARYQPKPFQLTITNKQLVDGAMERFNRVVAQNEMTTLWFSSPMTRVVEFGETVLLAKQIPETPLAVAIGSSSRVEFAAAHWWLTHDVGLEAGY